MRRTYKYRIYPTKAQVETLERWLGMCCDLYNAMVQQREYAHHHYEPQYKTQEDGTRIPIETPPPKAGEPPRPYGNIKIHPFIAYMDQQAAI